MQTHVSRPCHGLVLQFQFVVFDGFFVVVVVFDALQTPISHSDQME